MIVTTINSKSIRSISLPQKITGQYWLHEGENGGERLVSIEGVNGEWILRGNRKVKLHDSQSTWIKSAPLTPLNVLTLVKNDGEKTVVFTEPATEDRQVFTKYLVQENGSISIGRGEQNDICYSSKVVSGRHATLLRKDGRWYIQDEKSKNGTFVNQNRVAQAELKVGDSIFIMGLRVIIGKNLLGINDPDHQVKVSGALRRFVPQEVLPVDEDEEYEIKEQEYFYRSPRFKRDVETASFRIDAPPNSPVSDEMPWPLVMGSTMAMGMMSLVTLATAILTHNITSMVMGGSMMLGTLVLPLITKQYEKRCKRKKEALRQKKYREYLDHVMVQINEACQLQEDILRENHGTIQECEQRIQHARRDLWDRGMGQNDFLKVRLGHGDGVLDAQFSVQERKFSIDDDNLQEELYALCEKPKLLRDIPIVYSLFEDYVSGVIGTRSKVVAFAQGLVIQMAAMYSYSEVKFVFLLDEKEKETFEFVKWLPHVWSNDRRMRFIATTVNESKEVSTYLENVVTSRVEMNEESLSEAEPYYVIFSLSKELAARSEILKQVLPQKRNLHFSVITLYEELLDLPKECSAVVELDENGGRLFNKNDITGKNTAFTPDIFPTQDPMALSIQLANIRLDTTTTSFELPRMITFLELYGVGKAEHLNALTRWKENDPTKSLEAPVGVDTLGGLFKLDLHEKFHGPHGLVAGMTGSGKSEFIITYILSLAVNYHPEEVAFILIDYKGGGMAKSFEKLPHTAGIITNLDGAAIKRSLISIESELKRRQKIFSAVSQRLGVSNIDIYKYQKLHREGTAPEPLQHLFIISDEFAELKTQQSEFMAQLVSAARIGRSLGVHLILATQKPSGVVDDQIWSNSKFKVCLKVQERSDSMDMLKRPDAAELTDTGRFYLQVGYNELFELGQSAWAGATYEPADKVRKEKDDSVVVVDTNGHILREVKPARKQGTQMGGGKKQMDIITEYLRRTAEEEGVHARPLWLEPIPEVILLRELREKYAILPRRFVLEPLIGEYDDPGHQRQAALCLPLTEEGNAIVYGAAGSGKTSFLNAMICSLLEEHTPEEVNLYLLDFASETLQAFVGAPHVGEVILSYEAEKISNLFKMLKAEMERRKKLFAEQGGDYASYLQATGEAVPSIVVVINNFAAFTEAYEEKEDAVTYLSREGTKYGIYFVLTVLGSSGVRFRLAQNFKQLFVLQLNDEAEYSTVVGKTDGLIPSRYKGRGLTRREELYEFQVAMLSKESLPQVFIREFCARLREDWQGEGARKVPILPKVVDVAFLKDHLPAKANRGVPVGVERGSLNVHCYPFFDRYITMVTSNGSAYQNFLASLSVLMGSEMSLNGTVFDVLRTIPEDTGALKQISSARDCEEEVDRLFDISVQRNNLYKDSSADRKTCFEPLMVVINGLGALKGALSETGREKLELILEKGSADYGITVIIGEQASAISSVSFERWYKTHILATEGIWIGNGVTEQYQMKASKTTAEMYEEITAEFGYSFIQGKTTKIKILSAGTEEDDEDES